MTNTCKFISREIYEIIIHCSATRASMDIGVDEIRPWHKARGFSDIGYHRVVRRDGVKEDGRDLNIVGAHVRGRNTNSIGICLVGGVKEDGVSPEDNFTDAQWDSLRSMLKMYKALIPDVKIHGHNEFANKACPCFDVQYELAHGRLKGIE